MPDQTIVCPQCANVIPLSQALAEQFKHELEQQLAKEHQQKTAQMAALAAALEKQKLELETKQKTIQEQVKNQLETEKQKMWLLAQEKAQAKVDIELKDLQAQTREKDKKLAEAQEHELELRKQTRELEDQKKSLNLEIQRQLDEERKKITEELRKTEGEQFRLKLLEKDKQVEIMQKTIEDLRRQSQQGSMQIQGEVQENDLKNILSTTFFTDQITDVPTGIKGGDLIQIVNNQSGQKAGVLLWESKNTKAWSNDWLVKLKQDQGAAGADICLLVTRVLPDDIKGFGVKNNVWVLEPTYIIPLVTTLRYHLLEVSKVKNSLVGREQKMEYLYQYLAGSQFKNRIESIVMAFSEMQTDLLAERRAMERIWRKRGQEIERVIENTAGLYGDLQGIVGASLPAIQALELPTGETEKPKPESTPTLW